MPETFLTAEWEYLAMVNYAVDPDILLPWLPAFTELDFYNSKALVSLVGFYFRNARTAYWPFAVSFPEVNLRFYVKYFDGRQWKRGVAFVSGIVPLRTLACTARLLYHEPYRRMPVRRQVIAGNGCLDASYEWKHRGRWNMLRVKAAGKLQPVQDNTEEAFVTDRYHGYNRYSSRVTVAYEITHPAWQLYPVNEWALNLQVKELYGTVFEHFLQQPPTAVLLARGSAVAVHRPVRIVKTAE